MADRLEIYRGALRLLGPSNLASLTEDRPERHTLDGVWQTAGDSLLQEGLWNHAIRSSELTYDEDVEPLFGYRYAFSHPEDFVRLANISQTADYREGLNHYETEAGYFYADLETIYIRYVSNDADYGWNVGAWPVSFATTMSAYLAFESGLPVSADRGNRNDIYTLYQTRLGRAKTLDAVDERVHHSPPGRLTRARLRSSSRDRYRA